MRIKWNTEGASPDGFVLGPNGDTVATITHEGIGWTLRMVSPYPAATSRGFAQVRSMLAWTRGQMKRVGR